MQKIEWYYHDFPFLTLIIVSTDSRGTLHIVDDDFILCVNRKKNSYQMFINEKIKEMFHFVCDTLFKDKYECEQEG